MCALPMTGKPGQPWQKVVIILVLLSLFILASGCSNKQYQAVPECDIASPPDAEKFIKAGVDEKLVLMTNSYISASKNVANCNNRIRLVNASNKSVDKLDN